MAVQLSSHTVDFFSEQGSVHSSNGLLVLRRRHRVAKRIEIFVSRVEVGTIQSIRSSSLRLRHTLATIFLSPSRLFHLLSVRRQSDSCLKVFFTQHRRSWIYGTVVLLLPLWRRCWCPSCPPPLSKNNN